MAAYRYNCTISELGLSVVVCVCVHSRELEPPGRQQLYSPTSGGSGGIGLSIHRIPSEKSQEDQHIRLQTFNKLHLFGFVSDFYNSLCLCH